MSEFKVVSRKDLFNNDESIELPNTENDEEQTYELPSGLEIIEIEVQHNEGTENGGETKVTDEFDFPLFSLGADVDKLAQPGDAKDSRGHYEAPLVKVSLRQPSPELFIQERPRNYYFMDYSEEDRERFRGSAIEYDSVLREVKLGPNIGWPEFRGRVLDVKEHDEQLALREGPSKKRRPGKKQRLARKTALQNEKEREEKDKEIRRMIKKKFHKRGGKKNKKTADKPPLKYAGKLKA